VNQHVRDVTSAVASGDSEAFACFYRERFDEMFSAARRASGRDESFCLDVVHDAMLKVIRGIKTLESEDALSAWLRRVVTRTAYDMLRAESRRAVRERAAARSRAEASRATGTAVEHAALQERLEWLREELSKLDEETARLLHARHRAVLTLKRIGRLVGLKPGAVDGRLQRAAGRLRSGAPGIGEVEDES